LQGTRALLVPPQPNASPGQFPSALQVGGVRQVRLDSARGLRLTAPPSSPRFDAMPPPAFSTYIAPIVLLTFSNVFMTFAWYGHLRFKEQPLALVVLVSWLIAFFEYCLAVPANRYGNAVYSAAQLKTIQEVITLSVFAVFSTLYLKEPLAPSQVVGFALIALGAFFVFSGRT
jgi:uncharacterized protein (DUF486 family)